MAKQTILDWIDAERGRLKLNAQNQTNNPRIPGAPMKQMPPGAKTQPQANPNGAMGKPMQPDDQSNMIDPKTGTVMQPDNPSPVAKNMAEHVGNHVQDPLGSTKDMFDDLQQKNLAYEQSKDEARRQLLPVKQVIQHVEQTHNLNPDEQMGWTDPNTGQPIQNGMPPGLAPQAGSPMGPLAQQPGMNKAPIPPNMAQTPGAMNTNRPSQAGFAPGVAPAQQQQVRPGKMGQPTPGQSNGTGPGNPSNEDPKTGTARPANKARNGGKKVTVHVQGRAAGDYGRRTGETIESIAAAVELGAVPVRK